MFGQLNQKEQDIGAVCEMWHKRGASVPGNQCERTEQDLSAYWTNNRHSFEEQRYKKITTANSTTDKKVFFDSTNREREENNQNADILFWFINMNRVSWWFNHFVNSNALCSPRLHHFRLADIVFAIVNKQLWMNEEIYCIRIKVTVTKMLQIHLLTHKTKTKYCWMQK